MRKFCWLTMLTVAMVLSGCKGTKEEPVPPASTGQQGAQTGTGEEGAGQGQQIDENAELKARLQQRVIYFDFDSYEIGAQYRDIVAAHARALSTNPNMKVRLEGHTDERGSREYNIGLGERRAQAVRRALMLQGAGDSQVVTVSYGEERPAVAGSDESAWAKNRRVEIVYSN
jgi:peptidoglycan-associated lipoprotein